MVLTCTWQAGVVKLAPDIMFPDQAELSPPLSLKQLRSVRKFAKRSLRSLSLVGFSLEERFWVKATFPGQII